jgi:hypothetical protein
MVVLCGLISRPGFPCLRAAVASYLLHWVVIAAPLFSWIDRGLRAAG